MPVVGIEGQKVVVDEETIMGISSVKSAVDIISGTIGSLPLELYKPVDGNAPEKVEDDDRLRLLNLQANNEMSAFSLKRKIAKDLLLYGQNVVYIERNDVNDGNKITSLYPLDTKNLQINVYTSTGYSFRPEFTYNSASGSWNYDPLNVVNIVEDSDDGIIGKGVMQKNANTLALAINQNKFEQTLLSRGAVPMGAITYDRKIAPEALDRLKTTMKEAFSGAQNAGKTMFLEGGTDYKQISTNPDDLQLDKSKSAMLGDIARMFNIPETMINADANKYNSNEQNNIQFFQYCLSPLLSAIESAINNDLLLESEKEKGYKFQFNTDAILQNTLQEKVTAIGAMFNQGLLSYEEARHKFGLSNLVKEDFINLSLGSVLMNPETGEMTIPNTMDVEGNGSGTGMNKFENQGSSNKATPFNQQNQKQSHINKAQNNALGGGGGSGK